jgi:nucleoside-diphosphate-sugar epimerase
VERILIAGCGYVGGRLAELLAEDGREVFGLSRSPGGLPGGVAAIAADVTARDTLDRLPDSLDAVVYAVSPSGRSGTEYRAAYVDGLANVLDAVESRGGPPRRVILVSSTGVYGHTDGRWVDERTPPEPSSATAERILEGERLVREADVGVVLRLGGIYGPGRDRTVRRVRSGEAECPPAGVYGNRIHRDDAARALRHLLALPDPEPVYLGVDREPAELREVYRWIAERTGARDPCADGPARDDGDPSGRRGTNKRCSSERLAASGFAWRYPTYREGYAALG